VSAGTAARTGLLSRIAETVGTPVYVYSTATLERHFTVFRDAFAAHEALGAPLIAYALKANANIAVVRTLARRQAKAPVPARTFPAALPWFRLDRIYVRGFQVEGAQVMHGTLWAKLSDHAPIVSVLKLA